MAWYVYLAHFFAGAFLANGVPHFIHGISGERFQSPFASPPAVGESSPTVNIIWGVINFALGYGLLVGIGNFRPGLNLDILMVGLGAFFTAMFLAAYFGSLRHP